MNPETANHYEHYYNIDNLIRYKNPYFSPHTNNSVTSSDKL